MTSKEIEEKLSKEHIEELKSGLDAIVPPLHANCYCKVSPMTEQLEQIASDAQRELDQTKKEFDEWLNS